MAKDKLGEKMRQNLLGRYSEALDVRVDLLRFWNSPQGKNLFLEYHREIYKQSGIVKMPVTEKLLRAITVPLLQGETFYWSPQICQLIFSAAQSIPRTWILREEGLDSLCGFAFLATPFKLASSDYPVSGITWAPVSKERRKEGLEFSLLLPPYESRPVLVDVNKHCLVVTFLSQSDIASVPFPFTILFWPINGALESAEENISDLIDSKRSPPSVFSKMPLFATMLAFLQQRILIPSRFLADRAARRRVEKTTPEPVSSDIEVIRLRKVEYRAREGKHRDVEWSCQWIVHGHWRNQWHPSKHYYHPKYIAPYIKGPEDKPLRHAERLFAVVR